MNQRDNTKLVPITIRIAPEVHTWLVKQAQKEKRSLNAQIALVLERVYEQAQKEKSP